MNDQSQGEGVAVRFASIRTHRFVVEREAANLEAIDDVVFGFAAGIDWDLAEGYIAVHLVVRLQSEPRPDAPAFATVETETRYWVRGLDATPDATQINLPDTLVEDILSNAYATTRGLALVRGQGTVLEKFPLPMQSGDRLVELIQSGEAQPLTVEE